MEHVVFMNKKFKGLKKILSGEKTAEARYAQGKRLPHGRVAVGDTLYFKSTGEDIYTRATVTKVYFSEKLTPDERTRVIEENNSQICMTDSEIEIAKTKRHISIIYFNNMEKIDSFAIDKSNYSSMADWIPIEDVSKIKIT